MATLGLMVAVLISAIVLGIFGIFANAIRTIWRPVGRAIHHAILSAIAVLVGAGVLQLLHDQPELMRIVLGIGMLVLALRLAWRRVRDPFKW